MNPASSYFPSTTPGTSLGGVLKSWYCLRVMARREHIAARNLNQRTGVSVFSPRIRVRKKLRGDTPAFATEALFPGYVFARFNFPAESRHVASTPGVLGLVSFGGPPPAVADAVIDHLSSEVNRVAASPDAPLFEEGAWVKIVTGCFQGSEGRVMRAHPASTRICVLLKLLGQDIQVSMRGDQLACKGRAETNVPCGLLAKGDPVGNRN